MLYSDKMTIWMLCGLETMSSTPSHYCKRCVSVQLSWRAEGGGLKHCFSTEVEQRMKVSSICEMLPDSGARR